MGRGGYRYRGCGCLAIGLRVKEREEGTLMDRQSGLGSQSSRGEAGTYKNNWEKLPGLGS